MLFRRARIGVVPLVGVIGTAVRPSVYVPLLEGVSRSRALRALVLDIDSPGGSAAASEELYRAVQRVARRKPVVAYIRNMGTSGAYYLSCGAHRIIALPTALVGSIGVLYLRPLAQDLLRRLGLSILAYKSGPFKDMGGFWRPPTPEEEERYRGLVDDVFGQFIRVVAQGRKMDEARVRELATGEVFTASQALSLGLVDEVGDMERAVQVAAEMGKAPRRVTYVRPRPPFLRRLVGGMAEEVVDRAVGVLEARLFGGFFWR